MSELKINPTPQQVVMLCSGETIELNGKKISLTVVEQEVTDTPPAKSLKYKEIVKEVKPNFWVTLGGSIQWDAFDLDESCTNVPTEGDAKKLRATAQLLVVMHHANGGEWMPYEDEKSYTIYYSRVNSLCIIEQEIVLCQIYFRTRELAEQALNDNKQLFNEYFGIDE
jgi:hypothetical protein